jgi:hypothetical protein
VKDTNYENSQNLLERNDVQILIEHRNVWHHTQGERNFNIHSIQHLKSHMKVFISVGKDGTSFRRQTTSRTTISEYRCNIHDAPNYTAAA